MVSAYFTPLGAGRYRATEATSGAWSTSEQHISPTTGLLVHEVETQAPSDLLVSRISVDILGVVPVGEVEVTVVVVRPGRTIELVAATVSHAGRAVVAARLWRLAASDTSAVAGPAGEPLGDLPPWDMSSVWPGGYIGSLDVRRSADAEPGRARVWVDTPLDLVEGVAVSPLARWCLLLDTANGVSVREDPAAWLFPNVDLTVHLHRQPVGAPLGLDTTVTFGPTGQGLTHSVVHDRHGPVGVASQVLTLRAR